MEFVSAIFKRGQTQKADVEELARLTDGVTKAEAHWYFFF